MGARNNGKPCLGYPSRTAAVVALRQQGLTTREIAAKAQISVSTVAALEWKRNNGPAKPKPVSAGEIRMAKLSDYVAMDTIAALRPHAARRNMSVSLLMRTIIDTVALGKLVDAVLDDADERAV